jgi:uncharacterized protein (DUF302 family)
MTSITKRSRFSYAETLSTLESAIASHGNTVFAKIDQASAAQSAGLSLRPTTLLVFGNPKGGTALMDAFPLVALDLPLKLVVWEDGGVVNVSYVTVAEIAKRYGVTGMDDRIATLDKAVDTLTNLIV